MSAIYYFGQPFQIVNIFYSRNIDKNHKMTNILVSHFILGDHHLGDEKRVYIYIYICYLSARVMITQYKMTDQNVSHL
jgi:hypothetical protein